MPTPEANVVQTISWAHVSGGCLSADAEQHSPHSGVNWTIVDVALGTPPRLLRRERLDDNTERLFYEGGHGSFVERFVTDAGFPPHYFPDGRRLFSSDATVRWRWYNAEPEPRSLKLEVVVASNPSDPAGPRPLAEEIAPRHATLAGAASM